MVKGLRTESIHYYFHAMMQKGKAMNQRIAALSSKETSSAEVSLSIRLLKENADELGIRVEDLVDGAYEFKLGNKTRRIKEGPILDLENAFSYWLCGDKYATFEILRKYGFQQVPHYQRYSLGAIKEARQDFQMRKKAVVIKPCSGTCGGEGVTVGIRSLKSLNKAIYHALMYDGNYLMEDFIEGDHFRVLFFKDRMLDSFQRIPANVMGDGKNNIKDLIRIENDKRAKKQRDTPLYPIVIDNDVKQSLLNKKLTIKYVPSKDEIVYVKTAINFSAGGETKKIGGIVHEDVVRDCRSIMKIMDVTLGGIDIITKNIERPLSETGGAINEVNTSPMLSLHSKDVIKNVLNLMFE